MNKMRRYVLLPLLMIGLTGCDMFSPTENIEASVANTRVAQAMNQMTTTEMNSFELSLDASLDLGYESFDETSTKTESNSIVATGSLDVKASNLFNEETGRASVVASASVKVVENASTVVDEDMTGSVYYDAGWAYVHVTGLDTITNSSEMADIKGKVQVGPLSDLFELPGSEFVPTSEGMLPTEDMVEMLAVIDGVKATETNDELTVVYTITIDDVVDAYIKIAEMSGEFNPSDFTSSEFTSLRNGLYDQISSVIKINTAKVTIGVNKEGYLSKFYVDVDVEITEQEYVWENPETIIGKTVIAIDANLTIDLTNVNKTVTITLPSDLNTYPDMTSQFNEPVN